ncbi:MAG: response regulator [Terricaulis sp.]
MGEAAEEAILRVLVVDHRPFQRRLIAEALRALGRVEIGYSENIEQCLLALTYFEPTAIVFDDDIDGGTGLSLARRLRGGEAGDVTRRLPMIMVTQHNTAAHAERARNAGVDELVLRPFSTATLIGKISEVRNNRREFIESAHYVGPDRRRRRPGAEYEGPRRRLFDQADKSADAPDVQIRKGLARMYVERISTMIDGASDREAMRELCLTCGQLSALASDMRDRQLESATSSLFNYLKGVGAGTVMNRDVVQAHLDTILQLAELPNSQMELRQTVTQQLGVMVTKKLRQAGQAA